MNKDRKERNKEIIEELEKGIFTLEEVGERYDLTRERIRQIWENEKGRGYKKRLKTLRKYKKEIEDKRLKETVFKCRACEEPVTLWEKKKDNLRVFCSKCAEIFSEGRDPEIIRTCRRCGEEFHPWRNEEYTGTTKKQVYCKRECFLNDRREKKV